MVGDPSGTGGPPRLRPTVVAGPAATAPDQGPRPTALPTGRPARAPETKAMKAGLDLGRSQPPAPVPPTPVTAPTAIRGAPPRRPAVGLADLRRHAPQARPQVIERALTLLRGVNLDAFGERQAALWGQDLQREHAGLVSGALDLSQSEALHRAAAHLGRLTALLGSIDVEAAVGANPPPGLIGWLVRSGNAAVDTTEELAAARAEIDQLLGLLAEAMPRLLTLREAIERHWGRIEAAGDKAEALALAAEALAGEVRPDRPDLARRLDERAMSLIHTLAQVRGAAGLREAQAEQPMRLVAAIQDVALVQLPGWLASVMAFAAAGGRRATPTEAGELVHRLRTIARQLNP